jgi:hypothetical protein
MSKQPRKHADLFQEEAERLARLPPADQAAVIAMYSDLACNPLATPACRVQSIAKAEALEKLLGLPARKKSAKASGKTKKGKPLAKAAAKSVT